MNLLLDTHIFIWLDEAPQRLPARWQSLLADPQNELWLSVVSLWEMQIKIQLGRLTLQLPLPDLLAHQQQVNGIHLLLVEPQHVYELANLPLHHSDPFDRLLIAQARSTGLTLASVDGDFPAYPVTLLPIV